MEASAIDPGEVDALNSDYLASQFSTYLSC